MYVLIKYITLSQSFRYSAYLNDNVYLIKIVANLYVCINCVFYGSKYARDVNRAVYNTDKTTSRLASHVTGNKNDYDEQCWQPSLVTLSVL